MKLESIDPNKSTPELLAHQVVEFVAKEKPDYLIAIVGKQDGECLIPSVAHTKMNIEQLLYFRQCLDVHIRGRSDETLALWMKGKP